VNAPPDAAAAASPPPAARARSRGRWKAAAILAVCLAPVVASYTAYYVIRPEARTNYGELIEPQRRLGDAVFEVPGAAPLPVSSLRGHWILVSLDGGACDKACADKLYAIRQVRLTTGKDRDRIERLMLVTDDVDPSAALRAEHEGMRIARIAPQLARETFPAPPGGRAADHVYVVDPLGNLMMRFPAPVDPNRMKKDVGRLLRASRSG